jgi:hypothetical protein
MFTDSLDIITQAELKIGTDLMENASIAARVCKTYMQELQSRLGLGGTVERGPLTFNPERMRVCHTEC